MPSKGTANYVDKWMTLKVIKLYGPFNSPGATGKLLKAISKYACVPSAEHALIGTRVHQQLNTLLSLGYIEVQINDTPTGRKTRKRIALPQAGTSLFGSKGKYPSLSPTTLNPPVTITKAEPSNGVSTLDTLIAMKRGVIIDCTGLTQDQVDIVKELVDEARAANGK